ncbi:MAG: type II toxin-antitoxin system RelE/ParE family toxin [Methanospirillaceae archaeon]|nr:type II toxin-antitoxin system RelE/ParE family toxin [Methanospirillaceae archaeon]
MYQIRFSSSSYKYLLNLNIQIRKRIFLKIETLKEDPMPHGSVRIKGTKEEIFRIRVGEYRILYEVDHGIEIIDIIKIGKRSNVYS